MFEYCMVRSIRVCYYNNSPIHILQSNKYNNKIVNHIIKHSMEVKGLVLSFSMSRVLCISMYLKTTEALDESLSLHKGLLDSLCKSNLGLVCSFRLNHRITTTLHSPSVCSSLIYLCKLISKQRYLNTVRRE